MKIKLLVLLFATRSIICFSQETSLKDLIPARTAVKVNFNGLKIGVEQRLYKKLTFQFEVGKAYEGKSITLKPQLRLYQPVFSKSYTYLGLAYYYKHQETSYNDTLRKRDENGDFTGERYTKDFIVNKFIHAITLNTGFLSEEHVFGQRLIFEFNVGLGVRYKKSTRYGLEPDEDFDLREAMWIRPAQYEDTHGAFKIYPEINLTLSLVIPIVE